MMAALAIALLAIPTRVSRADDDAPTPAARLEGGSNTAVAFSRDGSRLLTAGGREARVWDVGTLKPACPPLRHAADVTAAALSPDGTRVATAAGDEATIWDAATGARRLTLTHNGEVLDVAFSPDGKRLATACLDRTARAWDAASGDQVLLLRHDDPVRNVSFSPDGARLLTGTVFPQADPALYRPDLVDVDDPSEDGDAFGWDLADARGPRWHLAGLGMTVRVCRGRPAYSPDGRLVGIPAGHAGMVLVNATTGEPASLWPTGYGRHGIRVAAFGAGGRVLAAVGDDWPCRAAATVRVLAPGELNDGAEVQPGDPPDLRARRSLSAGLEVAAAAVSPDGRLLALGADALLVLDTHTGKIVMSLGDGEDPQLQFHDPLTPVAFSPDGRLLAVGFPRTDGGKPSHATVWKVSAVAPPAPADH